MKRMITQFGLILALLLLPSCVCFAPCPMSPSNWAWLGIWPGNISIHMKDDNAMPPGAPEDSEETEEPVTTTPVLY